MPADEMPELNARLMTELNVTFHEHELRHFGIENLPVFDFIHASLDCKTYSKQAYATHRRDPTTGSGISAEADKADADLNFFLNLLESQMDRNPKLLFTLENPYNQCGGMHCQPSIDQVLVNKLGAKQCNLNCT